MYVIIVGGGKMGSSLAEELAAEKHDVVIIDSDPKVCEELASLNATVINGDGIELKTLEQAGLEKTDVVVALTSKDETNLMVCLLAKAIKHCKSVARISHAGYEKVFKRLGIDIVVYPESAAADYLEELITKPDIIDLAFIERGDAVILEFVIKENSKVIGKQIKELEYPKGSLIIAVYEDKKLVIPDPKTKIREGDKVLVLAKNEVVDRVRKMFG